MRNRWTQMAAVVVACACLPLLTGCVSAQKARALQTEIEQRDSQIGDLQAETADLKEQLTKARQQATGLQAALNSAEREISKATTPATAVEPATPAEPTTAQAKVVLMLDGSMFPAGKATLTPDGKKRIRAALSDLRAAARKSYLRIEGHSDNSPINKSKYKSNSELSAARALSVLIYLETEGRVPPSKLYIAAYGAHRPIADNKLRTGRTQNRRVQIVETAE